MSPLGIIDNIIPLVLEKLLRLDLFLFDLNMSQGLPLTALRLLLCIPDIFIVFCNSPEEKAETRDRFVVKSHWLPPA